MVFRENVFIDNLDFSRVDDGTRAQVADIPTVDLITGVEVRLSRVFIRDNKTAKIGPIPGLAKVYLLNLVASDISESQIQLDLNGFEKVDDNSTLAVDRTLFLWKKDGKANSMPSQIHVMSSLIKSKKDLRDAGKILAEVNNDQSYKELSTKLGTLLKSNSATLNISNLIFNIAGIVGKYLVHVEDKPLLTRYQSFTDVAGDFTPLGKTELPFSNRYASLDYAIYVRDKAR